MTKHQYRLVKVEKSDGPTHEQNHQTNLGTPGREPEVWVRESSSHPLLWMIGIVAIALIVAAVLWMSHVSTALAHTNAVVTHNAEMLGRTSSQLATLQAKLSAIGQQLKQLQSHIANYFTTLMNAVQHKSS